MQNPFLRLISGLSAMIFGVIEVLLVVRFGLVLFGANRNAGFVEWIINATKPLLTPFQNIFGNFSVADNFLVESNTLFAIFIYAIIAFLIIEFIYYIDRAVSAERKPSK